MKDRSGLTLVDLMVALSILAVILTTVYAVFASQDRAVRAASETRDVYGQGLLILDRLSRDLSGAWLPASPQKEVGILYGFEGQADRLDLATTARLSPDHASGPDVVEVGYRIVTQEDLPGPGLTLVRRQDETPDDEPGGGGTSVVLTRDLVAFELSYLTKNGLSESSWEAATAGDLPAGVIVRLVLSAPGGREETFTTLVSIPLAQPAVPPIRMEVGRKRSASDG